jgi:hypothetical protein
MLEKLCVRKWIRLSGLAYGQAVGWIKVVKRFWFRKIQAISSTTEELLANQEGVYSIYLVTELDNRHIIRFLIY